MILIAVYKSHKSCLNILVQRYETTVPGGPVSCVSRYPFSSLSKGSRLSGYAHIRPLPEHYRPSSQEPIQSSRPRPLVCVFSTNSRPYRSTAGVRSPCLSPTRARCARPADLSALKAARPVVKNQMGPCRLVPSRLCFLFLVTDGQGFCAACGLPHGGVSASTDRVTAGREAWCKSRDRCCSRCRFTRFLDATRASVFSISPVFCRVVTLSRNLWTRGGVQIFTASRSSL